MIEFSLYYLNFNDTIIVNLEGRTAFWNGGGQHIHVKCCIHILMNLVVNDDLKDIHKYIARIRKLGIFRLSYSFAKILKAVSTKLN